MPHLPGQIADLGGSLGVAAILLVGGWLALRWQQDRHRFQLMQTALEKGITRFPDAPPYWLVSMRQALTMLALGIALAVVGGGAFWLGRQTPMADMTDLPRFSDVGQPREDFRPFNLDNQPDRRPDPRRDDDRPGNRFDPRPDRPPQPPRPGPRPMPQFERWHQAQAQQTAGLASIGIGVILLFVGVIRVVFAQAERQYSLGHATQESNF